MFRGVRAAADLVEQCGGGAAVLRGVTVLDRQVRAHELLDSVTAPSEFPEAFALSAELIGEEAVTIPPSSPSRPTASPTTMTGVRGVAGPTSIFELG